MTDSKSTSVMDRIVVPPNRTRCRLRSWGLLTLLVLLILLHAPLLRSCTHLVTVGETLPARVDAVVILKGDDRHAVAARWVQSGFASTILLPRVLPDRNVASGIIPPQDIFTRKKLQELGVNDLSIQCLDDMRPRGEWRFARLLEQWLHDHPETSVVICCGRWDSRLTRDAIDHVLSADLAHRVYVHGLPSLAYDERVWWHSRSGTVTLFNALLSLTYARSAGEDPDERITWDADAYERGLKRK